MKIGIIGGSGLDDFGELNVRDRLTPTTSWGEPSSPLICGVFGNTEVVFIARHGETHSIPPHRVNYRANIAALKDQQVSAIYAVNVVGGINMEMCPGDVVIPDQIIDYTWGRKHTYSDGPNLESSYIESPIVPLQHVDFTNPYDTILKDKLLQQAIPLGLHVHAGGVYGATQGPRLETAAEISRMERDGCDIVGMTGMPEAALAREMGIPYACLALVVNLAAGLGDGNISMDQIQQTIDLRMADIRRLLVAVAKNTD
ncbi:MAG: S-methyl-5'-thioinosine phosphorylase [Porticoccus sp.]